MPKHGKYIKEYPEHEKMSEIIDNSQSIGEFLEWLNDTKKYRVCEGHGEPRGGLMDIKYYPIRENIDHLLAEFFDIDLDKIEQEKREMLEDIRKMNARE